MDSELIFTKDNKQLLEKFSVGFKSFTKRAKLTPKQISKALGVTESAVNGWKYGRSFPDVPNLFKLIELGLSFSEIVSEALIAVSNLNVKEKIIFDVKENIGNLKKSISPALDKETNGKIENTIKKQKEYLKELEENIYFEREIVDNFKEKATKL